MLLNGNWLLVIPRKHKIIRKLASWFLIWKYCVFLSLFCFNQFVVSLSCLQILCFISLVFCQFVVSFWCLQIFGWNWSASVKAFGGCYRRAFLKWCVLVYLKILGEPFLPLLSRVNLRKRPDKTDGQVRNDWLKGKQIVHWWYWDNPD